MSTPNDAVTAHLTTLANDKRKAFSAKLVPTIPPERFLGVTIGQLRALAKDITRGTHRELPAPDAFLTDLPHPFIEHDLIHMLLLNEFDDLETWRTGLTAFLPHIDNWMVTDAANPTVLRTHPAEVLAQARAWLAAGAPYTQRTGLVLMIAATRARRLGTAGLEWVKPISSDHYYVNMAAGWYVATVFEFHPEETKTHLEAPEFAPEVRRLAIRKIIESRRTSADDLLWARELRDSLKGRAS